MNLLTIRQTVASADSTAQIRPLARKRELGAFYTPSAITEVLCDWAIKSSSDVVLEPSFGGCTFIDASVRRLHELGEANAKNLFGCDIDPSAFEYLRRRVHGVFPENFYLGDFLSWTPSGIPGGLVDVVIGNPPYVRYSNLAADQRSAVDHWAKTRGEPPSRRASLWLYFTIHALSCLRKGGRMAWVLPISFMTAHYASSLRQTIFDSFRKVAVVTLTERVFVNEGTEERTLIVLAEGYGEAHDGNPNTISCLESIDELKAFVFRLQSVGAMEIHGAASHGMVPGSAGDLLTSLELEQGVKRVGELADVQIGTVSGDSKFFIKNAEEWKAAGVSRLHLRYVVPRSRWLDGLMLGEADKRLHERSGVPCLALDPPSNPRAKALLRYLKTYAKGAIATNSTFSKRPHWYRFLDEKVPDALFVFMTHLGPRLVINSAKANSTNSLYRIYFNPGQKKQVKLLAISLQTTFTQLAAERLGRILGSGGLKLEPSEVKRLPVLLPEKSNDEVREAFAAIDKLVRQGDVEAARKLADAFVFSAEERFKEALPLLGASLETARRRRIRSRQEGGNAHG
ncbi:MAG TPA: N-6 DNA methylase [Arenimonas sp.]|uniref:HsdM family class I SAM-dependent methyltransferase n=1 Tax=Arenimonas sp. TaxID=1872635 RepID=UPI002D7E682E|nr:N-6 DNA methylase [Arenimonas sp.]HEU0153461.1 N-6 DNA methylase [Arenimonas sp.]